MRAQQDFLSVITSRHCKQAFVDQAVPPAILVEVLRAAAHAPSSRNAPQYSVAGYAGVIRTELGLGDDRLIVCSLAVGYADETAPVNRFVPERALLEEYVQWYS